MNNNWFVEGVHLENGKGASRFRMREREGKERKRAVVTVAGPTGIPNIAIQKAADLLEEELLMLFRAAIELGKVTRTWKISTTVVLRKPGRDAYDTPKSYRLIALLDSIAKILTSIVADDLSNIMESKGLLPRNHFGGRPGRTTSDALMYLTHRIKMAWAEGKVINSKDGGSYHGRPWHKPFSRDCHPLSPFN